MARKPPPEPPDCTCGGVIPKGRRDGFCSSWCAARDAQGLPPLSPPPRFTSGSPPPDHPGVGPVAALPGSVPGGDERERARAAHPSSQSPPAAGEEEPKRPRYRQRRRPIADEVEDRLREAGMLDSWQGAAALDLADALDWQGGSGSARAALHKQLRDVMHDLLLGQDEPGSRVGALRDEVAERRARRAARAGGA